MKCSCLIVIVFGLLLPSISSRHVQFYRKDYTYFEEFDAFYKLHWDINGSSWDSAFLSCYAEGATLFYPKAKDEWTLVNNLTDKMIEKPNVTSIFVGLHDKFALGEFITVDGQSTPYPMLASESHIPQLENCVTMNIETGVFDVHTCVASPEEPLPFVCKKVDTEPCPTVDPDYRYEKVTRKCYKLNKKPKTWMEAMRTCFMEGGVLAVIENKIEAEIIADMTERENTYYVGVFKLIPGGDLYTVKGQNFSEVYQNHFDRGDEEHYGYNNDQEQYVYRGCGAVYSADPLRTTVEKCYITLPFICEMDAVL